MTKYYLEGKTELYYNLLLKKLKLVENEDLFNLISSAHMQFGFGHTSDYNDEQIGHLINFYVPEEDFLNTLERHIEFSNILLDEFYMLLPKNYGEYICAIEILPIHDKIIKNYNSDNISKEAKQTEQSKEVSSVFPTNTQFDKSKIFIVHGHDEALKEKTARFIQKLGLEPIILSEQANAGKTVIEKLEEYTDVGFGIVLYTACDVGSVKAGKDNLKARARQNVVLEHGYLMGKIGRENVCALVEEDVETPSDISGVVYIPIDKHEAWKTRVAKELKQAGYDIDMNLL